MTITLFMHQRLLYNGNSHFRSGIIAFFIFICYLHNVRPRRQRIADLLRYSDRRAATPCRQ